MIYWPTSTKEVILWFYFQNIMDYNEENIETEITLLPLLLTFFAMFQLCFWYNKENVDGKFVENVAIRCSNCGKSTGIYTKNINTNYNEIITQFMLN